MDTKIVEQIKNICKYMAFDLTKIHADPWQHVNKEELAQQVDETIFKRMTRYSDNSFTFNVLTLEVTWHNYDDDRGLWRCLQEATFELKSEKMLQSLHSYLYRLAKQTAQTKAVEKLHKHLLDEELKQANIDKLY